MNDSTPEDPFAILGVGPGAGEEEVRARYLELVKQYPPEREPEKFRQVRAAFEAAKDPLTVARRLLRVPSDETPQWSDVLQAQKQNPPRLTPAFIVSLGNRESIDNKKAVNP
jgi:hypothetical protein